MAGRKIVLFYVIFGSYGKAYYSNYGLFWVCALYSKVCSDNSEENTSALVQALRLCTGRTAHRGSRGIALLFLDHGTRRGWGVSVTPRPLYTPGKDKVPVVQEAGWAPGPVWTDAENLATTGIRSPDRPARSQSLYRLRYPAHGFLLATPKFERTEKTTKVRE